MTEKLRLEWRDPATLTPNPRNFRRHPEEQKKLLAAVIDEVGWAGCILFNETTGRIIDGHARQEEALRRKDQAVPVLVGKWTEQEELKILATFDPIAAMAQQADDIYRELLADVETDNEDLQGWLDEISNLMADKQDAAGLTDPDEIPEIPEKPISKTGDLWILGDHRLLCGDSTKKEDVSFLLKQDIPELMVTDPPYGVEYDAKWRNAAGSSKTKRTGVVLNDSRCSWASAYKNFPGNIAYIWHAGKYASLVQRSLESCDFSIRSQIIWVKQRLVLSRGDYHWRHEPCWYAVKSNEKSLFGGGRKQQTVWSDIIDNIDDYDNLFAVRIDKNSVFAFNANTTTVWEIQQNKEIKTMHSTQKPVECMARPIRNHLVKKIYDPFSGSGSTFIACELNERKCFGVELCEAYCDLIVTRWQNFTGRQAILDGDGRTFEEIASERC